MNRLRPHPACGAASLQSDPGTHDGGHDRARHAYDGGSSDLQPDRISCHYGHADLSSLSYDDPLVYGIGDFLLPHRYDLFLCGIHSYGALHRLDPPAAALGACRMAEMERGKALQVTCFSGMRSFRSRVHRDRKGRIISRGADEARWFGQKGRPKRCRMK